MVHQGMRIEHPTHEDPVPRIELSEIDEASFRAANASLEVLIRILEKCYGSDLAKASTAYYMAENVQRGLKWFLRGAKIGTRDN